MENPFGIKVRKCKKSDYQFVKSITEKTLFPYVKQYYSQSEMLGFKKRSKERFEDDWSKIKIVMKGKRRIGFYQVLDDPNVKGAIYVRRIFFSPAYQGKGIGRFLMGSFEKPGYKTIWLQTWDNNPAVKFYRKCGYKVIAKKNHKYTMQKLIRA